MTKKHSKCLFVVFAILLVVFLFASFVGFTYPLAVNGNYYTYSNFISNLRLGEDIGTSVRFIYRAEPVKGQDETQFADLKVATIDGLYDIIQGQGFQDVNIAEYGNDCILVQVGNILSDEDKSEITSLIGNPEKITFSAKSDGSDPFADGQDIKKVTTAQQNSGADVYYFINIEFKDSVKDATEWNSSVYIYIGDKEFTTWTSGLDNGVLRMTSEDGFKSMADATTLANSIKVGMLPLSLIPSEPSTISASYGINVHALIYLVMAIMLLAGFAYLIVKFKHVGWLASFNMLFFVTIGLFFLQSIPLVHINFAGIITMMIIFFLSIEQLIAVFESAKQHYQQETPLYVSFKLAQKENLFKILIQNATFLLVGLICVFMPVMSLQSFGWVSLVLSIVSTFTSLVMMKLFIKMYLALNNTDGKKCNFHKGGKNV